ncbi:MAG: hypothetical protein JXR96_22080 [Deltaproteobacteria bacterium]|nr:hypothetical protein [Deltaproteobacteria bacterium]
MLLAGMFRRRLRREGEQIRARQALLQRQEEALHLPGGSPERPIVIDSPSVVEPKAESVQCPICGGDLRVSEHRAEVIDGARLRVARVHCSMCGDERDIFFQLRSQT